MKTMKITRGLAREIRRTTGGGSLMKPPSLVAQAAMLADQRRANHKLGVQLYHKSGHGVR